MLTAAELRTLDAIVVVRFPTHPILERLAEELEQAREREPRPEPEKENPDAHQ